MVNKLTQGKLEPKNSNCVTKVPASCRSLSKIRRIYCGCAGFGQIFRSFSLNSPNHAYPVVTLTRNN